MFGKTYQIKNYKRRLQKTPQEKSNSLFRMFFCSDSSLPSQDNEIELMYELKSTLGTLKFQSPLT